MEEHNLLEKLEVNGDQFLWVEVGLCFVWGVGGVRNLRYNWVESFIELWFDSPTCYFEFVHVTFVLEIQNNVVSFSISNILGNLICISFLHICNFLKIENQYIHNWQRNLLENKCVTNCCSNFIQFGNTYPSLSNFKKKNYQYPRDRFKN